MKLSRFVVHTTIVLSLLLFGQSEANARASCLSVIANYTDVYIAYWGIEPPPDPDYKQNIKQDARPGFLEFDPVCPDDYMTVSQARLCFHPDKPSSDERGDKYCDDKDDPKDFVRIYDRMERQPDTRWRMGDDNQCVNAGESQDECVQRYTYLYDAADTDSYPECWLDHHMLHKTVIHVKASVYKCTKPNGGFEYQVKFSCLEYLEFEGLKNRGYSPLEIGQSTAGCE